MLFISRQTIVNGIAGRCYLCSQNTLAECAGSNQPDSSIYTNVLQYYTEPCNGQCVLFRNEDRSIIRGCSWTYGHMTPKSIGWHEISPGVKAYFCDSHLCNNGTYEQPEISMTRTAMINNQFILSAQELFLVATNNPSLIQNGQYLPLQVHQCYSCTARFKGCGEVLDPHYASNYIRPCPSSCIIFRNPNDLNLITRDCSILWPQVQAKNGLHKLLGSDAFFCQESLCNGINFDFIIGIFHNQLPVVVQVTTNENILTTITTTTTATITTMKTTIDIYNDNLIWDDPDLDFVPIESTTPDVLNNFITSSTLIDHFDFVNEIAPSSTIVDGLATVQPNLTLNWWSLNDTLLSSTSMTSTLVSSTLELDEDDSIIFNTTLIPSITRFEHLLDDDDDDDIENSSEEIDEELFTSSTNLNPNLNVNMSNYSLISTLTTTTTTTTTTTSIIDLIDNYNNNTQPFDPFYFYNKTKHYLFEYMKPSSTFSIPPISSMLTRITQNRSQVFNSTIPTKKQTNKIINTTSKTSHIFYEYCKNKQCYHGGRLNSDCLCICLPAFTGDNCETVLCEQEPTHICAFVLDHECQTNYIRYLCPKFCQMNNCSSPEM
ncbi:unnamed protein product [Rotaria sp. Silwood1]|nr:unnamed protein product [Rotaria sp. Silwood1]